MTPDQFLAQLRRQPVEPAYLFLGTEAYQRSACRRALIERALPEGERESGVERRDLDEVSLGDVVDDARTISLFSPRRVIWVSSAESALPRGRAVSAQEDEAGGGGKDGKDGPGARLAAYLKDPTPGVVVVLNAARYDFDGEDKTKLERVRKFYSSIRAQVEFQRYTPQAAHRLAQELAKAAGLRVQAGALEELVEAVGADASRIATEIEKLRLWATDGQTIGSEQIAALAPNARATTIFALVGALGRGDRSRSLDLLDTLIREGEYLPLALAFLATQFRYALAAQEAGLRSPQQIQAHFSRQGMPMWPSRAEQVYQTLSAFRKEQLETGIRKIHGADRALRDARPDDRVIMESFVLALTR